MRESNSKRPELGSRVGSQEERPCLLTGSLRTRPPGRRGHVCPERRDTSSATPHNGRNVDRRRRRGWSVAEANKSPCTAATRGQVRPQSLKVAAAEKATRRGRISHGPRAAPPYAYQHGGATGKYAHQPRPSVAQLRHTHNPARAGALQKRRTNRGETMPGGKIRPSDFFSYKMVTRGARRGRRIRDRKKKKALHQQRSRNG